MEKVITITTVCNLLDIKYDIRYSFSAKNVLNTKILFRWDNETIRVQEECWIPPTSVDDKIHNYVEYVFKKAICNIVPIHKIFGEISYEDLVVTKL